MEVSHAMCAFQGKSGCLKRFVPRLVRPLYSEKYRLHCLLLDDAKQSIVGLGNLSSVIVFLGLKG